MIDSPAAADSSPNSVTWSWPSALVGKRNRARARRVLGDRLERRQRVAQRLARRRRRDDDHVLAGMDRLDRLGLVRRTARSMPRDWPDRPRSAGPASRHRRVDRLARRDDGVMDDAAGEGRLGEQVREDGRGIGGGVGAHRQWSLELDRTDVRNGWQSSATLPCSCDSLAVTRASVDTPAARSYARRRCPAAPASNPIDDARDDDPGAPDGRDGRRRWPRTSPRCRSWASPAGGWPSS